jgi:DNA/RNA-binding domain of Phe-tRNA-synthetase-like protein
MFDAERLGDDVSVRFGRAGESYVFNASGQSMDLSWLPVICGGAGSEPVGNAVRDSMVCKVFPGTSRVLAVVYASRLLPRESLDGACGRLRELLISHAGAEDVSIACAPDA